MILEWIASIVAALCPSSAVSHLRSTAPTYLTTDADARDHLASALVAGAAYAVPALLSSIAWHESRYQQRQITPEVGGHASCGVMTPEPTTRAGCRRATSTLLSGYLAGARHLRGWLDVCGQNVACALWGYAGGYRLIAACRAGVDSRGCRVPWVFVERARAIGP